MELQPVDKILRQLKNVRRSGDCYTARCPAHADSRNSLSVAEGDDNRVLMFCHAGCSTDDVVQALGLTMRDLFPYA
jgi:putative DNA primase/helicase